MVDPMLRSPVSRAYAQAGSPLSRLSWFKSKVSLFILFHVHLTHVRCACELVRPSGATLSAGLIASPRIRTILANTETYLCTFIRVRHPQDLSRDSPRCATADVRHTRERLGWSTVLQLMKLVQTAEIHSKNCCELQIMHKKRKHIFLEVTHSCFFSCDFHRWA